MAATIDIQLAGLKAEITALTAGKVDLGSANASGILRLVSGAGTTLVDIVLAIPAFAAGVDPIQELQGLPLAGTAVAAGTAATARVLDRDENIVFTGIVTVVGGNGFIQLDKVEIEVSDVITLQSGSFTYP